MRNLDIGCKRNKLKGFIGIDRNKDSDADVFADCCYLPFKDDVFGIINCSHVLEHLKIEEYYKTFDEMFRVSKNKGTIKIKTPHFSSVNAFIHPEHIRYFTLRTFKSLCRHDSRFSLSKIRLNYMLTHKNPSKFRNIINSFFSLFVNLNQWICERVWCYLVGGFSEIECELTVIK